MNYFYANVSADVGIGKPRKLLFVEAENTTEAQVKINKEVEMNTLGATGQAYSTLAPADRPYRKVSADCVYPLWDGRLLE